MRSPARVLILENEPLVKTLLQAVVRSIDFDIEIEWARTPGEATALLGLRNGAYELLIYSARLANGPRKPGVVGAPRLLLGRRPGDLQKSGQSRGLPADFDLLAARRLIQDLLPPPLLAGASDGAIR